MVEENSPVGQQPTKGDERRLEELSEPAAAGPNGSMPGGDMDRGGHDSRAERPAGDPASPTNEDGVSRPPAPELWHRAIDGPADEPGSPEGAEESEASAEQRRSSLKPLLIEIIQTVLLTLVIFLAVRSVVQNFKVDGASMEPTLHSGQYLLISKLSYFRVSGVPLQIGERLGIHSGDNTAIYPFGGPQRGDIIVFRYPGRPDRDFIKRVIALPGDEVRVERGRVYVNGVMLREEYIQALPAYSMPARRIPEGQYFVLGDNRPNSSDSHIWGEVPEDNIIGKAWLSYWPPGQWGVVANSGMAGN